MGAAWKVAEKDAVSFIVLRRVHVGSAVLEFQDISGYFNSIYEYDTVATTLSCRKALSNLGRIWFSESITIMQTVGEPAEVSNCI